MTYEEAIQFWYGRINYEHRVPHAGDLNLERMRGLLSFLDNPHQCLRIIHVAGSKGKGSTCAFLESILQHAGHRVGLFTSPHLLGVEERIQVNRQPISKAELAALMRDIRDATPAHFLARSTFFEIGTALGFLHFLRQGVDFAIVEVGLGGRFDSTNVCDPLAAVITSISLDHTQILGDTSDKIAFEKAGIIKTGRPTISGVRDPAARHVIESVCRERASPLTQIDADFSVAHEPALIDEDHEHWPTMRMTSRRRDWPAFKLGLIGEHQADNAAVALAVVETLGDLDIRIEERTIAAGLASIAWPARLEIMSRKPLVILDCAHNVASAQALVRALDVSFPLKNAGRRLLIFGGNRDKDLRGMLDILGPHFERIFLTGLQTNSRSLSAEQIAQLLPADLLRKTKLSADSTQAWQQARAEANADDHICIAGSVYLAGELRPLLQHARLGIECSPRDNH